MYVVLFKFLLNSSVIAMTVTLEVAATLATVSIMSDAIFFLMLLPVNGEVSACCIWPELVLIVLHFREHIRKRCDRCRPLSIASVIIIIIVVKLTRVVDLS